MKTAPFIVLDGGEGAGKTTLLKRLKSHFGDTLVATREPGGSPEAEAIRAYIFAHPEFTPKEQFDLFWKARELHLRQTIIPAIESGKMVVCDRFDSSTFAYQLVEKGNMELEPDFWEKREQIVGTQAPDLYIYLDVDVETGLRRKHVQQQEGKEVLNHFDDASVEDQKRRQHGFLTFFQRVPHRVVDANRGIDEVYDDLVKILEEARAKF